MLYQFKEESYQGSRSFYKSNNFYNYNYNNNNKAAKPLSNIFYNSFYQNNIN